MLLPKGTTFAVVDGTKFELLRNTGTEKDPKLTPLDTPKLEVTNYSEGIRRNDTNSSFPSRTGHGANSSLDESAHVIAVSEWLNQQVLGHEIDKLIVIADPKSLGVMRKRYHKQLEAVLLGELAKTMTGRPTEEIISALQA